MAGLAATTYALSQPPIPTTAIHALLSLFSPVHIEFNTISSSFGSLSERAAAMHGHILASTSYLSASPYLTAENFPENNTTSGRAEGLAKAHDAYGVQGSAMFPRHPSNACRARRVRVPRPLHSRPHNYPTLLFLSNKSTPNIRNLHNLFPRILNAIRLSRALILRHPFPPRAQSCHQMPITALAARRQQESPGSTHAPRRARTLPGERRRTMAVASGQRSEPPRTRLARREAASLVLKPQRKGGGINVYREAIPAFLDSLRAEERETWIAMEMIETPRGVGEYLVRAAPSSSNASDGSTEKKIVRADVISELGIFGYALFGTGDMVEKEVGWLVRTKGTESNEGGVAAGFSVLDSAMLVWHDPYRR
ncbi:glutathione synthetase ATP-binding domain-like protein [Rhizopogon vinicolor AM-OR11-026]|uniref:Glutathione synthetase n=1 Tax=Rhizopogon vinicolor AM-OR11-026 TaxID=1314800 RepID=A0A1B7NCK6_9AGAM|nr:glutathione synthetase ATP-binding domain-like protein [Rhizopogon vinicolor AM-OR11-026]